MLSELGDPRLLLPDIRLRPQGQHILDILQNPGKLLQAAPVDDALLRGKQPLKVRDHLGPILQLCLLPYTLRYRVQLLYRPLQAAQHGVRQSVHPLHSGIRRGVLRRRIPQLFNF